MLTLLTIAQWGVPALILAAPFILSAWFPPARRILMLAIPIPLFVLAALAAFWWLNRESAIVAAVKERVAEMTAGAQLDALKARLAAQSAVAAARATTAAEALRRARVAENARDRLEVDLLASQFKQEDLENEIDDILAAPVAGDCTVDDALARRLRNR